MRKHKDPQVWQLPQGFASKKACKCYCASTKVNNNTAKSTFTQKSTSTKDCKPIGTHAWIGASTKARKLVSALPQRNTRTKTCKHEGAPANQCIKGNPKLLWCLTAHNHAGPKVKTQNSMAQSRRHAGSTARCHKGTQAWRRASTKHEGTPAQRHTSKKKECMHAGAQA